MFEAVEGLDGVMNVADDFLVFGQNHEEHDYRLNLLLKRLQDRGITLNPEKCEFRSTKIKFLGHLIEHGIVKPDPDKVEAVLGMSTPTTRKELRSFLGLVNYLMKFIPHMSEHTKPLSDLLSNRNLWTWDIVQENCFIRLKSLIAEASSLVPYDVNKETRVSADASSYGIGAVLEQKIQGRWCPVQYLSRKLSEVESRYSQIEKEALGLTCCVDEIAAQHIGGDAIIHFGHSCLTSSPQIPVLNIFQKKKMDFSLLQAVISEMSGSVVVIYDIGYHHLLGEIQKYFSNNEAIIPEILLGSRHNKDCSAHCKLKETGEHSEVWFSRGYCLPKVTPKNLIYIGDQSDACFKNFSYLFKDAEIWNCSLRNGVEKYSILNAYKHISYLIEEIRAAGSLTIVVVTLAMKGYLEAIDHVKMLAKKWNKKVYVISVGKPTIAKLTNFPEMELFVIIGCTELELPNRRELIQPVVGLLEVELALNSSRTWNDTLTRDFRDLIPGGQNFIPLSDIEDISNVSLINGKINKCSDGSRSDSSELAVNQEKGLASASQKIGGKLEKSWFGLEQVIGETPASLAVRGRHGTSTGYQEELNF